MMSKKNKLSKNEIYLTSSVFGFLLGLLFFIFFSPNYYLSEDPVELNIKSGSTFSSVLDSLQNKGIIRNKTFVNIAAFLLGADKNIKAGKYIIPNGLSYIDLITLLTKGSPNRQKLITIPEGIWQHKLAELLRKELNLDSAKIMKLSYDRDFLFSMGITAKTAEGYLLPDTYFLFEETNEKEILRKLKSEMDKIFEADSVIQALSKTRFNKHQILTLASIIEGESNIIDEFKIIAGVYHNRLKRGMLLQADPTIQYLKRNSKNYNRVLYKDLEIKSPYNTYIYAGLPPSPINNPGRDAVLAAIFPEENNYLYLVADGTGGHKFSETLSEHNKNVQEYRRWRSAQK